MLYPLKFNPILKPVLWGGENICAFKGLPPREGIGESWEISGVVNSVSVVANGPLKGKSLRELTGKFDKQLLGQSVVKRFGISFPLLVKFIDAKLPLSVQVHPDDDLAKRRHHSPGKTEMWYVVKAEAEASLFSGFKDEMSVEAYLKSLQENTLTNYLREYWVKAGDVFFLPAGRVHAIGAGCFIAEIQQSSDITYRIYDYNRVDANGQRRDLHTELAREAIDYGACRDLPPNYSAEPSGRQILVRCPYFTTARIAGRKGDVFYLNENTEPESFLILIGLRGEAMVTDGQKRSLRMQQGETVLIPAANASQVRLEFTCDGEWLETGIDSFPPPNRPRWPAKA